MDPRVEEATPEANGGLRDVVRDALTEGLGKLKAKIASSKNLAKELDDIVEEFLDDLDLDDIQEGVTAEDESRSELRKTLEETEQDLERAVQELEEAHRIPFNDFADSIEDILGPTPDVQLRPIFSRLAELLRDSSGELPPPSLRSLATRALHTPSA